MSRGTPNQTFRLLPSLKAECERTIEKRNNNTREAPWSFTEFIEIALREKIAKMERSRRSGRRFKDKRRGTLKLVADAVASVQVDNGVEQEQKYALPPFVR